MNSADFLQKVDLVLQWTPEPVSYLRMSETHQILGIYTMVELPVGGGEGLRWSGFRVQAGQKVTEWLQGAWFGPVSVVPLGRFPVSDISQDESTRQRTSVLNDSNDKGYSLTFDLARRT